MLKIGHNPKKYHGSIHSWIHESMDQWIPESMDPQIHRHPDLGFVQDVGNVGTFGHFQTINNNTKKIAKQHQTRKKI